MKEAIYLQEEHTYVVQKKSIAWLALSFWNIVGHPSEKKK